ncbi:MAG: type II toxin-antitoxin system prevent-host-death family antitoxin [Acidimicrobiales bacterium]|nr:type II toxin-antitoxin system prevent-host-death family antitoxin [Acidimicrobiales bacterium]
MESIGVRELRNNVAAVLRRAAGGERIAVTVDGVPTAQLGPLEPTTAPTLDDLVATGLVEPPRRGREVDEPDPVDPPIDIRLDDVLDALRGT